MTPQANLIWEGSQFCYHSLAITNREYCAALSEFDSIDLTIVPYEPDQFSAGDDPRLLKLKSLELRTRRLSPAVLKQRPLIWVRQLYPLHGQRPPLGAKFVMMIPWEYSVLPIDYAARLQGADEIWTASSYSRETLVRSGLPGEKVHVVPNGVDPELFTPQGDRLPLATSKTLRFLFVGATILYRKGVDVLLEAYCRAFTHEDDVCLVIKETSATETYHSKSAAELIEKYTNQPTSPAILYLTNLMSDAEMARLYRACDIFVASYRGEGFSLPTLEAMSSGLPVIVPRGGATDDFVTDDCGWLIDSSPRSIGSVLFDLPLPEEAFLREPDLDHLVELLRTAYADREGVIRKGAQAAVQAQHWTWREAAVKILQRIDALCGTTTSSFSASNEPERSK